MSILMDDVLHLSREIGPRPAGTEEERTAAMYIAENIQKRSGLTFEIEDFDKARGRDKFINYLSLGSGIFLLLSVLLSFLAVPAVILTLAIAVICVLSALGKPVLPDFLRYGISQNIVAKFVPAYSSESKQAQRKRKIVFISHYDSGHTVPSSGDGKFALFNILKFISLIAVCLCPLIIIIKSTALSELSGMGFLLFIILIVLLCAAPTVLQIVRNRSGYNEGANCNATGSAALIEIARQLGTGSFGGVREGAAPQDIENGPYKPLIHGVDDPAFIDALPKGANVNYVANSNVAPRASNNNLQSESDQQNIDPLVQHEKNLNDAKAAIAAFTAPRGPRKRYDNDGNLINEDAQSSSLQDNLSSDSSNQSDNAKNKGSEEAQNDEPVSSVSNITIDDASAMREASESGKTFTSPVDSGHSKGEIPSWYKSAQSKARKDDDKQQAPDATQRSKFAHTIDVLEEQKEEELRKQAEAKEAELQKMRERLIALEKEKEELRKQQLAENKPFFRADEFSNDAMPTSKPMPEPNIPVLNAKPDISDSASESAKQSAEKEPEKKLSLDERFKRRQQEKMPSNNADNTGKIDAVKPDNDKPTEMTAAEVKPIEASKKDFSQIAADLPEIKDPAIPDFKFLDSQDGLSEQSVSQPSNVNISAASEVDLGKTIAADPINVSEISQDVSVATNPETGAAVVKESDSVQETTVYAPRLRPESSGPINLDKMKQYAPLDDESFISSNTKPSNAAVMDLPTIDIDDVSTDDAVPLNQVNPSAKNADLMDIPTINDAPVAPSQQSAQDNSFERGRFGTGSFAAVSHIEGTAGATGTFAPVTSEILNDMGNADAQDMIIEDADDSVYDNNAFTDTGAFAGRGYVDIPDKKRKGLLGGFFSKKDKSEGLHADSEPLSDSSTSNKRHSGKNPDSYLNESWDGGAFSSLGRKLSMKKNQVSEQDFYDKNAENQDYGIAQDNAFGANNFNSQPYAAAPTQQFGDEPVSIFDDQGTQSTYGVQGGPITSEENRISSILEPVPAFEEQIQDFHDASINIEVWMVALGSEIDENAGIKAFLLEHAQELRGAILVDIEALGAGELCLVESEGLIRKSKTGSRIKRYIRKAAHKTNMSIPSVKCSWGESSAAYANKRGFKAVRLVGMQDNKPAYYLQPDDKIENINEQTLTENVNYLLSLIQSI